MKIITWNIETAGNNLVDKVVDHVDGFKGDIIALQETKNEITKNGRTLWDDKTSLGDIWTEGGKERADNYLCGVSLLAKNATIERLVNNNDEIGDFTFIALYKIILNDGRILYIFNVWLKTFNGKTKISYMERLKNGLKYEKYEEILKKYPSIILGDFNIYDSISNHNEWMKWLEIKNNLFEKYYIESAWHTYNRVEYGKEGDEFTLFHQGKYHCDFCLYSTKHFNLVSSVIDKSAIGNKLSDHNPVITELIWK
ncbi:endonuclease/exonuclease/phosphatase family protein [Treponema primitia]|uniref:endonuclease/exonuclease/phosphatase family protein n=1 Tax=Treponema primitia TaxID=88058 RepID=UPI0002554D86|nr:endonuclease/exonuclease/phosphatase family protein [Treponema primitia]